MQTSITRIALPVLAAIFLCCCGGEEAKKNEAADTAAEKPTGEEPQDDPRPAEPAGPEAVAGRTWLVTQSQFKQNEKGSSVVERAALAGDA